MFALMNTSSEAIRDGRLYNTRAAAEQVLTKYKRGIEDKTCVDYTAYMVVEVKVCWVGEEAELNDALDLPLVRCE